MDIRNLKAADIVLSVALLVTISLTVAYITHHVKEERLKVAVDEYLDNHKEEWRAFQKANPEVRAIVMHSETGRPGTIRICGAVADEAHLDKVAVFLFRIGSPYGACSPGAVRVVPEAELDQYAEDLR